MMPISHLVPVKPDVVPKLDLAVAMQEYIRGQMDAGCINHCPEHLGIPHKIIKAGWVDKRWARFKCCSAGGDHSGSVCALWYQINGTVPKELVPELEKCFRYPPPAKADVTCRPCPEKYLSSKDDTPISPLSPRGKSYYEEGILNSGRDARNEWVTILGPNKRSIFSTPSTSSPMRGPSQNSFEPLAKRNKLEETILEIEANAKELEEEQKKQYGGSPRKIIRPKRVIEPATLEDYLTVSCRPEAEEISLIKREASLEGKDEATKKIATASWAEAAKAAPPRGTRPNLPVFKKFLPINEETKKMIYDGRDPLKAKLIEVYVHNMHRTIRGNLRKALRSDGIDTSRIIDIQFVGKSITMLLIPSDFKNELSNKLNALKRFQILDAFDPLDVSFMKTLPQYQEKSEEELLRIAMDRATARIARYIASLPNSRVGTIKYYKIIQSKLNGRK